VDEQLYFPDDDFTFKKELLDKLQCEYLFVAPARHHWKHCPAGLENSWFKRNDILIRALGRLFSQKPDLNAKIIFFEWGQEVDLSKQLINECGFADKVHWEPIQSKPSMKNFYNAADIVFDQFNEGIGTFGTVVPESLACEKPVILNYNEELHHWCYPELPPATNASNEEEIVDVVMRLLDDKNYRLDIGKRGRVWFMRYHSSQIVAKRHIDIYKEILAKQPLTTNRH